MDGAPCPWEWIWDENKRFEILLVHALTNKSGKEREESYKRLVTGIRRKTPDDVTEHLRKLEEYLDSIENELIPCPPYVDEAQAKDAPVPTTTTAVAKKFSKGPWTREEHKNFLLGMKKFGKGEWKAIAREFVKTRTAQQVASHAQKYFIRQAKNLTITDKKRRPSIHDMVIDDDWSTIDRILSTGPCTTLKQQSDLWLQIFRICDRIMYESRCRK